MQFPRQVPTKRSRTSINVLMKRPVAYSVSNAYFFSPRRFLNRRPRMGPSSIGSSQFQVSTGVHRSSTAKLLYRCSPPHGPRLLYMYAHEHCAFYALSCPLRIAGGNSLSARSLPTAADLNKPRPCLIHPCHRIQLTVLSVMILLTMGLNSADLLEQPFEIQNEFQNDQISLSKS
jgi:hypothetical protein